MNKHKEILNVLENTSYLYTDYILKQMKNESCLDFISKIIDNSGKEISEAILVFLSAIKYIHKGKNTFEELETSDLFPDFLVENHDLIFSVSIDKNVQANLPTRAMPILEILHKKLKVTAINLIELGASFGLIGRCLLNPGKVIERKENYFLKDQQIPDKYKGINYYLGIEIDPPDEDWLLAAIWEEDYELRTRNFIRHFNKESSFELIKSSAFGFSDLKQVKRLADKNETIIVLTSFMLYQFDDKRREILINEIINFTKRVNGHWINQAVNISQDSGNNEFFISWDNEKIIELADDTCSNWRWLSD